MRTEGHDRTRFPQPKPAVRRSGEGFAARGRDFYVWDTCRRDTLEWSRDLAGVELHSTPPGRRLQPR